MIVRCLFGRGAVPLGFMNFAVNGIAVHVHYTNAVAPNLGQVTLLEIYESLRNGQECRHAAGDEVLSIAKPDNEWARNSTYNDTARIVGIDNQQCIGSFKPLNGLTHGVD